jgi:origin recognition complex subunit 1
MNRITFAPYSQRQLQSIISARLTQVGFELDRTTQSEAAAAASSSTAAGKSIFHADAIELCARKVASLSGDARRALQICRRAVELCELEFQQQQEQHQAIRSSSAGNLLVEMSHIDKATKELFTSPFTPFLQSASLHEKLFLACCLMEMRNSGLTQSPLSQVFGRYCSMCTSYQLCSPLREWEFFRLGCCLRDVGLIRLENIGAGRGVSTEIIDSHGYLSFPVVRLIPVPDDLILAMQDDHRLANVIPIREFS